MQSVLIADRAWRDEFGKKLFELQQSGQFCDVIIKTAEDTRLLVHSCVLAASSPLLKSVIESALSDASLGTIMLSSDIDGNTWAHMLEYMYTGSSTVPDNLISSLQSGAKILNINQLITKCTEALSSLVITKSEVDTVAIEGELYSAIDPIKGDETNEVSVENEETATIINEEISSNNFIESAEKVSDIVSQPTEIFTVVEGKLENEIAISEEHISENTNDQTQLENPGTLSEHGVEDSTMEDTMEVQDEMEARNYIDEVNDECQEKSIVISSTEDSSRIELEIANSDEQNAVTEYIKEEVVQVVNSDEPESALTLQIEYSKQPSGAVEVLYTNEQLGDIDVHSQSSTLVAQEVSIKQLVAEDSHMQISTEEIPTTFGSPNASFFTVNNDLIKGNSEKQLELEPEFDVIGYSKRGGKEYKCKLCQKICKNPWDHRRVHNDAKPFVCGHEGCGRQYKCKSNLLQHMEAHKEPDVLPACRKCGKQFRTKYLVAKHESLTCNDNLPLYRCSICNKGFKVMKNLKYHEATHSDFKPYKCSECDKTFASDFQLKVHHFIHEKGDYKCHCGKMFTSERNYKNHFKVQHTDGSYKCEFCGKNFISAMALNTHQKTHSKPYACRFCNRGFVNAAGCYKHERKWHKEQFPSEENDEEQQQYQCPQCNEIFKSKTGMFKHLDSHFFEKNKFECEVCNKMYESRSRLESHMYTHGDFNYPCEECGKKFKTKAHLREHMWSHTKPFVCNICGGKFSQKKYLSTHMEKHEKGINPSNRYKCQVKGCAKSFPTLTQIKEHMKNEHPYFGNAEERLGKPKRKNVKSEDDDHQSLLEENACYNCDLCKNKYASEEQLTKHEIKKHNESRYACAECGVKFVTHRTLNSHEFYEHNNGTLYECEMCERKFFSPTTLSHHIDLCHTEVCTKFTPNDDQGHPLFICLVCTIYLPTAEELEKHEKSHPISELICRICKRSFRTLSQMKKHMNKCSRTTCLYCCQDMNSQEELAKHIRVHQIGKIVYKCSVCELEFNQVQQLKEHSECHRCNDTMSTTESQESENKEISDIADQENVSPSVTVDCKNDKYKSLLASM